MIKHENEVNFVNWEAPAVILDNDADVWNWYLGFFIEKNIDGTVHIDYFK